MTAAVGLLLLPQIILPWSEAAHLLALMCRDSFCFTYVAVISEQDRI